jgi:MSHA biogenesis protein MshO
MKRSQQGFTLIELILVILVLAIVSTSVTSFIRFGVQIYQDVSGRDKQISDSRFVIERLTRELRNALPNSVRVTGDGKCVEFIPILASSSYIDIPTLPDIDTDRGKLKVIHDESLDITNINNYQFVVYPLSDIDVYDNSVLNKKKIFDILTYDITTLTAPIPTPPTILTPTATVTIDIDNQEFFTDDSPTERYFIIKDSVAYCQGSDNTIKRYQGHSFTTTQVTVPAGTGVLMAERQTNSAPFSLQSPTLVRNAIVVMDFTFAYADENLRLVNEVHVANVP